MMNLCPKNCLKASHQIEETYYVSVYVHFLYGLECHILCIKSPGHLDKIDIHASPATKTHIKKREKFYENDE
jgi:hypothetical protein